MRVVMLIHISGTRDGAYWPEVGGTIDVPAAEASDMIACGYAIPSAEPPERAIRQPSVERAVVKTLKGK